MSPANIGFISIDLPETLKIVPLEQFLSFLDLPLKKNPFLFKTNISLKVYLSKMIN